MNQEESTVLGRSPGLSSGVPFRFSYNHQDARDLRWQSASRALEAVDWKCPKPQKRRKNLSVEWNIEPKKKHDLEIQ